jgi:pseudomonalisin
MDRRERMIKLLKNMKYKIATIAIIIIAVSMLGCDGTSTPGTRFDAGQTLTSGQNITSPNGYFALKMQDDGNLVLYHLPTTVMWTSCTQFRGGAKASLQKDGDFIVSDANGNPVWHSGTKGYIEDYLMLHDDGRLIIYAATGNSVWSATVPCTGQTLIKPKK